MICVANRISIFGTAIVGLILPSGQTIIYGGHPGITGSGNGEFGFGSNGSGSGGGGGKTGGIGCGIGGGIGGTIGRIGVNGFCMPGPIGNPGNAGKATGDNGDNGTNGYPCTEQKCLK